MAGNLSRRKFRLTPEQDSLDADQFTVDEIASFIEEHEQHNPEVVSVTLEIDDVEVGVGTTN